MSSHVSGDSSVEFSGSGDLVELLLGLHASLSTRFDDQRAAESSPANESLIAFVLGLCSFAKRLEVLISALLPSSRPEPNTPTPTELIELMR